MVRSAFTQLTTTDTKLIQRIVRRVYIKHIPAGRKEQNPTREDLFHYGVIGLLEAQRNFTPDLGAKWETFAAYRIEGSIIDNLRKAPLIRLPQAVQKRVQELNRAMAGLEHDNEPISTELLADKLGWTSAEVEKTRALKPTLVTAVDDNQHSDEHQPQAQAVLVEKSPESSPQANLLRRELAELLEHCLEMLPEVRDRIIVKARQLEDITLKELADSFSCSLESIRKREQVALIQLKECLQRHDITEI